jgi:hypothetical protein
MNSSAFLLNPLDPPELRDSADQMEDECLLLTADQAELLDTFRKDVRLCETEEEKFQLCAQMRSRLLDQYTQVELLIALFEHAMPPLWKLQEEQGKSGL